jgi:type II restriction enzyme
MSSNKQLEVKLQGKGQASRLGKQHELAGGPIGIFGVEAQKHDLTIREVSELVFKALQETHKDLHFRYRTTLSKKEINEKLSCVRNDLGEVLFVQNSSIKPDGGLIEVIDSKGVWRVILVGESKHQGNDVEKIQAGVKQGKEKDSDLMVAGNAIERVHKNILEVRNYMINETYFPYVVFLQGSNFATETFKIKAPDGREIVISHDAGNMNRIDRVTASNYSLKINKNYVINQFVDLSHGRHMLQIPSLYFQAKPWSPSQMSEIMWSIVGTSIQHIFHDT